MWVFVDNATIKTKIWFVTVIVMTFMMVEVLGLSGPNVCMVKQNYNITKRVKYRAPMSVRTYEWCFSMPPRCSRWSTEMRDLTRLETEERTAEVAICCPGYKLKDVSCVPICPNGKTGGGCSKDCPPNKWGPNCVNECKKCTDHGTCSPLTGECQCKDGWKGESCEELITTTTTTTMSTTLKEEPLTTAKLSINYTSTTSTPVTSSHATISKSEVIETVTKSSEKIPSNTSSHTKYIYENPGKNRITSRPVHTTAVSKFENSSTTTSLPKTTVQTVKEDFTRKYLISNSSYNRSEATVLLESTLAAVYTTPFSKATQPSVRSLATISSFVTATESTTTYLPPRTTEKIELTRKPETTIRVYPTTMKFKPKEIWIKPAQKGELTETKQKHFNEFQSKIRSTKELSSTNTTPRTIIVSIIPTSISSTFKKLVVTTATYLAKKNNDVTKINASEHAFTKSMSIETSTTAPLKKPMSPSWNITSSLTNSVAIQNVFINRIMPKTSNATNSMSSTMNAVNRSNISNYLTVPTPSTNVSQNTSRSTTLSSTNVTQITSPVTIGVVTTTESSMLPQTTVKNVTSTQHPAIQRKTTMINLAIKKNVTSNFNLFNKSSVLTRPVKTNNTKGVQTNATNGLTTDEPIDEETFDILTEPEHITAVMGDKGRERSSLDLISVISIAGGVMMAVITVAVVIVMLERCRRPRFEDLRKMNDIRMQVMIDNHDIPPPYVRSIFHTPLPDPPSEKCHYQPISTLDRNLKQFMRPVVVQTISPTMLENFRGILECHYDHLPRRNNDYNIAQTQQSVPSGESCDELRPLRVSLTESTIIEALKCEARQDIIDATTSEPLYAEIPCWRPPSEHAIEIVNLNGEAVTEL